MITYQKKTPHGLANSLSQAVFTKVTTEAIHELKDDFSAKGNDMELFQYLTTGTFHTPQTLYERFQNIDDLVLSKKFIPFHRPKVIRSLLPSKDEFEHYLIREGYEDKSQIELISRAILFRPELVILWKNLG